MTLWIQGIKYAQRGWESLWDFGATAAYGARQLGWDCRFFEHIESVPGDPENVLVASVEESRRWLENYGYKVPEAINPIMFGPHYLRRRIWTAESVEAFMEGNPAYPVFGKPLSQIKGFTGTVLNNQFDAHLVLRDYSGPLMLSEVVNFVSEWRLYVNRRKIVGLKHYRGDHLEFPDTDFIQDCLRFSLVQIPYVSFTLDFGVFYDAGAKCYTALIEPNDGWAIGNYGLEPEVYCTFVRDRWLQLTGIIK
jgi:hypothetical protein